MRPARSLPTALTFFAVALLASGFVKTVMQQSIDDAAILLVMGDERGDIVLASGGGCDTDTEQTA